jgi:hypothetical protein
MDRAVAGGIVTTTGGRGDVDLTAPDLGTPDGDDIEVFPEPPSPPSRGRMRAFLVGAIVVVLAAAAITIALINRDGTDSTRLSSAHSPTTPPTVKRAGAKNHAKAPVKIPVTPRASVPAPSVVTTIPNVASPTTVGTPAVTPTLPTAPPTTPSYPPSTLTWQTTPSALTVKAGGFAMLSLTVTNPTDGTVTLGQPLPCGPVLRSEYGGAAIGGVCAQMAQVMSPHQVLTQRYRIYATNTGDASGTPLKPGRYTARFENLHSIWVTVTAR